MNPFLTHDQGDGEIGKFGRSNDHLSNLPRGQLTLSCLPLLSCLKIVDSVNSTERFELVLNWLSTMSLI